MPEETRRRIVELSKEDFSQVEIGRKLNVNPKTVSKILKIYKETGELKPKSGGSKISVLTPTVVNAIIEYKKANPKTTANDIREELSKNKVCEDNKIPSASRINDCLRKHQQIVDQPSYSSNPNHAGALDDSVCDFVKASESSGPSADNTITVDVGGAQKQQQQRANVPHVTCDVRARFLSLLNICCCNKMYDEKDILLTYLT